MNKQEAYNYFSKVLEQLENEIPEASFQMLKDRFDSKDPILKFENNYIYVVAKDQVAKICLEKFQSRRMDQILTDLVGTKTAFKFLSKEEALNEGEKTSDLSNNVIDNKRTRNLRPEYTFEKLIVGESNRYAFITAMKIAESPEAIYNPFYIFGNVGLGKTHLMTAIGHYVLDRDLNKKVVFTTAQQFVEDYFYYTNRDQKNIESFYEKYREADLLLVDDIQMLEGKQKTQEEFFKVFDYLHEQNKQIVITSDRKADDLNLMNRLISRFNWGVAVDIKNPTLDMRITILRKKCADLLPNPNVISDECLRIIADKFANSVRDLEGALRRYVTYCIAMDLEFTPETVYSALESIMPKVKTSKDEELDKIRKMISIVCAYFKISEDDLMSTSRKNNIVYARNLCYYIMKDTIKYNLNKIGEFFGGKDHTTISHGIDTIKEQLNSSDNTKNDLNYVLDKLNK